VNVRRIGGIIAWVTVVVAIASTLFGGLVGGGTATGAVKAIATGFQIALSVGVALSIIAAIATTVLERSFLWTILPVAGAIVGIALLLAGQSIGPAIIGVAFIASFAVFYGEKSEPIWQKKIVALFGGLGTAALIIGGNGGTTTTNPQDYAGIILAFVGLALALVAPVRQRQIPWIGLLLLVSVLGFFLPLVSRRADASVMFLPLASIAFVYGLTSSEDAADRPVFGAMSVLAVLMVVIGGTSIGGVLGTTSNAFSTPSFKLGVDLYLAAGVLGIVAWIMAIVRAAQTRMWGWLAVSIFLVTIGALMYGLFGPSPADYAQSREATRLRRAAGA
jgi:hypothetical protein